MIVSFKHKAISKPTLEITKNKKDQIIIRFIPYKDEHITVHKRRDGSLLRTHFSSNKPKSVWDNTRVTAARGMGYKKPEKHGQYVIHTPLVKLENMQGYFLGGRLIELSGYKPKARYYKKEGLEITAPNNKFLLKLYLSTIDNPRNSQFDKVKTSLGDIFFEFLKSSKN